MSRKLKEFSTSSVSSASDSSDSEIEDLARLVNNIQLAITEVQQQTLPKLQSDLHQVQHQLNKKIQRKIKKKKKAVSKADTKPTTAYNSCSESYDLSKDFETIPTNSKFGYTKGDIVTIKNQIVVRGFRVPKEYNTGTVVDFTIRFVVVQIRYQRGKLTYTKNISRESKNIEKFF